MLLPLGDAEHDLHEAIRRIHRARDGNTARKDIGSAEAAMSLSRPSCYSFGDSVGFKGRATGMIGSKWYFISNGVIYYSARASEKEVGAPPDELNSARERPRHHTANIASALLNQG
jgi:hypothetical protein